MQFRAILSALIWTVMTFVVAPGASAESAVQAELVAIPAGHDSDLKFYAADGSIMTGTGALERMPNAGLVLWVAGNQFFAMDKVIGDFQRSEPGVSVGLITLPPGLILSAILGGGWTYDGHEYRFTPDV